MDYNVNCISCGTPLVVHRKHKIAPAQMKGLRKYCPQCHSKRLLGRLGNNRRKGKRYIDKKGYVQVKANGIFQAEHRVVMEKILGRPLRKGEVVHHIDGNPINNSPSNLELWLNPHMPGIKASDLICPHCGQPYVLSDSPKQLSLLKQRIRYPVPG